MKQRCSAEPADSWRSSIRAEPPTPLDGYHAALQERMGTSVKRAPPDLLDPADVAFVGAQLRVLDGMPDPFGVPCHRDWQARNWLIDRAGDVSAIDFEHAR